MKKEKLSSVLQKNITINNTYPCPTFNNDTEINSSLIKDDHNNKSNEFSEETEKKVVELKKKCITNSISSIKGDAIDLSVLKTQNPKETVSQIDKDPMCYLDLSNN